MTVARHVLPPVTRRARPLKKKTRRILKPLNGLRIRTRVFPQAFPEGLFLGTFEEAWALGEC
jgi:hypothetical protein